MALRGIRVLEFAGLAPAPFCGMILADFGAEVIRIDRVQGYTDLDCLANGKKSVAVNLKHATGVKIIKKLSRNADVLIEPFRKGVMESLQLGPADLAKENPKLIYARLTGYGQKGYYSNRAGHDINYLGLSGLLSLFGRREENPVFPTNLAADFGGGGLTCALGILMALHERNTSGLGQTIDCNMVHGAAYLGSWLYRSQKLPVWGKPRGENMLDSGSHFYEVYKTKDGKYMTVGAIEPQFYEVLLKGLNLDVFQFDDSDVPKQLLREKFLEKTQQEWCDIFDGVDGCVAPLLDLDEAPRHVHNKDNFVRTDDGSFPKPAPNLMRTPAVSQSVQKTPSWGEHTKDILEGLDYTQGEIADMERNGIIYRHKHSKL